MPYTQLNNLDFTEIKSTLKDYMRSQSDFTDYDFESSALSQLLDVLAYNTYYTAFNANMVVNELFLDSATLRDNVVSLAKQLGYTPKSITSPSAELGFSVTFPVSGPASIKLKAGTGFVTNYDKTLYRYVTLKDIKVPVVNNVATFSDVLLNEGSYVLGTFTYDGSLKDQKFKIQNSAADLNTLIVRVYESAGSSVYEEYKKSDNILQVGSEDKVYFINEIDDEQYELFFGDGILGKKLTDGNVIEISYILTKGSQSNGAKSFTFSGVFLDENDVKVSSPFSVSNIVATSIAQGGSEIESIEKIKFNAPKFYGSQNRAVTSKDYQVRALSMPPKFGNVTKAFVAADGNLDDNSPASILASPDSLSEFSTLIQDLVEDGDISDKDVKEKVTKFLSNKKSNTKEKNNPFAVNLYVLGYNSDKHLSPLNIAVKQNIKTYLNEFRVLTDGINLMDGFIINMGLDFSIRVYRDYNKREVLTNCISSIKEHFEIDNWTFNMPINIGEVEMIIGNIEGVQSVVECTFKNLCGESSGYSPNAYDVSAATKNKQIYPSLDPSIFEIKYPDNDIKGRVV
mgnify:CR=1 FL=1